ncbi:hypothetical protein CC78DRAFT_25418 [Lojkania enalia]|uniref:Uncharacterized protein n=1 Tax=Lojkania enalia TaxID=147567 RepID=A0A9P4N0H7_9PLEO|nr:hypothetical protein CC78DRAFT_25418 [Didymosphaeria enalia]
MSTEKPQWSYGASNMPTYSLFPILLPLIINFPLSIVTFVFQEVSSSILDAHNLKYEVELEDSYASFASRPFEINKLPTALILGTSLPSAVFAVLAAFGFYVLRGKGRGGNWESLCALATIFVTLGGLALVVACTVIVFNIRRREDKENFGTSLWRGNYYKEWTTETWLCGLKREPYSYRWASTGCGFAVRGLDFPWVECV